MKTRTSILIELVVLAKFLGNQADIDKWQKALDEVLNNEVQSYL